MPGSAIGEREREVMADIANYADLTPVIQISDLVVG